MPAEGNIILRFWETEKLLGFLKYEKEIIFLWKYDF